MVLSKTCTRSFALIGDISTLQEKCPVHSFIVQVNLVDFHLNWINFTTFIFSSSESITKEGGLHLGSLSCFDGITLLGVESDIGKIEGEGGEGVLVFCCFICILFLDTVLPQGFSEGAFFSNKVLVLVMSFLSLEMTLVASFNCLTNITINSFKAFNSFSMVVVLIAFTSINWGDCLLGAVLKS